MNDEAPTGEDAPMSDEQIMEEAFRKAAPDIHVRNFAGVVSRREIAKDVVAALRADGWGLNRLGRPAELCPDCGDSFEDCDASFTRGSGHTCKRLPDLALTLAGALICDVSWWCTGCRSHFSPSSEEALETATWLVSEYGLRSA